MDANAGPCNVNHDASDTRHPANRARKRNCFTRPMVAAIRPYTPHMMDSYTTKEHAGVTCHPENRAGEIERFTRILDAIMGPCNMNHYTGDTCRPENRTIYTPTWPLVLRAPK
eukprot:4747618-Pyramimonas_sp.AAC.1